MKEILRLCQNTLIKFLKHCFCLRLLHTIDFLFTQHTKKKQPFQSFIQKRLLLNVSWMVNKLFYPKKFKINNSTPLPLFLQNFFSDQPYQQKVLKAFVKINVGFTS